jgi:hypothetical protein
MTKKGSGPRGPREDEPRARPPDRGLAHATEVEEGYTNPFEHFCNLNGFDLFAFNRWLTALEPCGVKDELTERLDAAFDAAMSGNTDAALRHLEWMLLRRRGIGRVEYLAPLAKLGAKFDRGGRGKGPVRKAVERLLQKNGKMTTAELWEAIKRKPPKGYVPRENRIGKYIEGPTAKQDMAYRRFGNVCTEARKALRSR